MATRQGRHRRPLLWLSRDRHVQRSDGIQELRELDLYEISLTPTPANPDTRILSFKSTDPDEPDSPDREVVSPEDERLRAQFRDEMLKLLDSAGPADPIEREEKRQLRELRRKCDRLALEAALGFDSELISRLGA